jgi:hypothetical protein
VDDGDGDEKMRGMMILSISLLRLQTRVMRLASLERTEIVRILKGLNLVEVESLQEGGEGQEADGCATRVNITTKKGTSEHGLVFG